MAKDEFVLIYRFSSQDALDELERRKTNRSLRQRGLPTVKADSIVIREISTNELRGALESKGWRREKKGPMKRSRSIDLKPHRFEPSENGFAAKYGWCAVCAYPPGHRLHVSPSSDS